MFNLNTLDASIRDVTLHLSNSEKADILLYAMQNLPSEGSRAVIENAVESCLHLSVLSPDVTAKARVFRAKARLAAGSYIGAKEDLQAALEAEPHNSEAKVLLHEQLGTRESDKKRLSLQPSNLGSISNEVWREIALFLPRRDLKTLLFVPHTLSRVAGQLLFRKLDLHFDQCLSDDETNSEGRRLARRYADILTRIIIDPSFASLVRTIRIYAPETYEAGPTAFETGMLANALPKLINLRNVHISASFAGLSLIVQILQSSNPGLRGLSLHALSGHEKLDFLDFKHLIQFSFSNNHKNAVDVHNVLTQNQNSLRAISLQSKLCQFATDVWPIQNLTHIDFFGEFPVNSQAFTDILSNGNQLESLRLKCVLHCAAASQFRVMSSSVPFLRHFAFTVHFMNRLQVNDKDLFPAITEFLRGRELLRTLHLMVPEEYHGTVGFDSSVWGVLPSLMNLKGLAITLPRDLSPALASWLVPRSVQALTLGCESIQDCKTFLTKIRAGIPPDLRYIGLPQFPYHGSKIVQLGFPMVRLVRAGDNYWTVGRKEDGQVVKMKQWPHRREAYHATEWLEWFGCEDAQDPDHSEFHF